MKLVAARDKDRYHVSEALKQATQEDVTQAVEKLRELPSHYLEEFRRLIQAVEEEDQSDW